MKALEAELGRPLFDRSVRPPRLTPLGRRVAEAARGVVEADAALRALVRAGDGALAGDYRIGFVLTASVRLLPGFLARAAGAAPAARFRVETGLSERLARRVLSGALDAAVITLTDRAPRGLGVSVLAREEIVFALPPDAEGAGIGDAMARLPFLHFMPETGIGRLIARHLAARDLAPARQIELDGIEATVECVRAGVGFTALPRPDLERYGGGALTLLPARPPIMRALALVARAGAPADAERDRLAALMTGAAGEA
jgi:DNA-binding transcriptional LysR family regulator